MNSEIFEGQWKQMRGELRSWWGKLTDDDLEKIGGKKDKLVGVLQEKYGYTRAAAQQEVDRHFREYDERRRTTGAGKMGQTTSTTSQSLGATLGEVADEAKSAVEGAGASTSTRASQPISASAVGEKIGSLADAIRAKAPPEGAMGTAASTVANKLGAAGSYLQEKDWDHMTGDLSSIIRRYPIPSLLVGLGIGYLLAQRARR